MSGILLLLVGSIGVMFKVWMSENRQAAETRHTELKGSFDDIARCIAGIKSDMNNKVDQKYYDKHHEDVWKRIYAHYHEIDCRNPECTSRRTGFVVVPPETFNG